MRTLFTDLLLDEVYIQLATQKLSLQLMNFNKCIHKYNPHSGVIREMSDFRTGAGNK